MAKTGRPKSDNPKKQLIGLKLTEDEANKLKEYASKHDMTITQVLQKGIDMQYALEAEAQRVRNLFPYYNKEEKRWQFQEKTSQAEY